MVDGIKFYSKLVATGIGAVAFVAAISLLPAFVFMSAALAAICGGALYGWWRLLTSEYRSSDSPIENCYRSPRYYQ